jgi:glyoxylase-like metal-dependent hydrolase (beta-lactamase superfamily II)
MRRHHVLAGALAAALGVSGAARAQLNPSYEKYSASQIAKIFDHGEIHVLPVQGNVYMIVDGDVNVTAQVGDQGILLVDTGTAALAAKLVDTIRMRFDNKPIRYIINTHVHPDHTGGNEALVNAIKARGLAAGGAGTGGEGGGNSTARLIAHENVLNRMNGTMKGEAEAPDEALPTSTFFTPMRKIYFNGEPIEVQFMPNAHTDGDVIVFFRGSDVISAGDLFVTTSYPVIDAQRGGSIQGFLDALNHILELTVPEFNEQGGTRVIPGHGRLGNESDVDDYRNWTTIIRDRVQAMIDKGMTLDQVKASRVTLDFDGLFGADKAWTPPMFVEAVYKDLSKAKSAVKSAARAGKTR